MARHRKPPAVKTAKQRKPRRPRRMAGLATAATPLAVLLAMIASDTTSPQSTQDAAKSGDIAPVIPVGPFPADEEYAVNGELPAPSAGEPTAPVIPPDVLAALPVGGAAVPEIVLRAYLRAESLLATTQPGCHLTWSLLASIGRIESGHARGGQVDGDGKTVSPILGPALNGNGFAAIRDTDGGAHDGDRNWDRAVGPMQFIPATWARYGADATGDGVADPHNVYDAAVSAGRYLCSGGMDLSDPSQAAMAVFGTTTPRSTSTRS